MRGGGDLDPDADPNPNPEPVTVGYTVGGTAISVATCPALPATGVEDYLT